MQLSVQLDVRQIPPGPAWHAGVKVWTDLRNHLPALSNLTRLSIWVDAAKPELRCDLPEEDGLFDFDPGLSPILRLSMPLYDLEDGRFLPDFPTRDYTVVGRGIPHWWQEPMIEPRVTWYPGWGYGSIYDREEDHPEMSAQH